MPDEIWRCLGTIRLTWLTIYSITAGGQTRCPNDRRSTQVPIYKNKGKYPRLLQLS